MELGGPSAVALDVVPPRGMLSTGSGEGCCLWAWGSAQVLVQEELLKQMVAWWGEAPCDKVNEWDVGACPINM